MIIKRSYIAATPTSSPVAPAAHGQAQLPTHLLAGIASNTRGAAPLQNRNRTQTGQVSPTVIPRTARTAKSFSNTSGFPTFTTPIHLSSKPVLVKSGWSNQGTVRNVSIIAPAQGLVPNLAHRVVRST